MYVLEDISLVVSNHLLLVFGLECIFVFFVLVGTASDTSPCSCEQMFDIHERIVERI